MNSKKVKINLQFQTKIIDTNTKINLDLLLKSFKIVKINKIQNFFYIYFQLSLIIIETNKSNNMK